MSGVDLSRIDVPAFLFEPLPCLTADLPGIGGELKQSPSDFEVEEIPAYDPCGSGEHLFVWIQKTGLSAEELIQRIAKVCAISRNDIGMAGLKDRQAVTRQYVSIPAKVESRVRDLESDQVQVLRTARHGNKLRTGHLKGNQFRITLRDVTGSLDQAAAIAQQLEIRGAPNYFGEQRFGRDFENLRWGLGLLNGMLDPRQIPPARRKFLLRMSLSSVQSALFNACLSARLQKGLLHQVQRGDVLQVCQSGGPFVSTEPDVDQPRFDAGEVVTTGPIFGPKMKAPQGPALEFETALLRQAGLEPSHWEKFPQLTSGTRRALLIRPLKIEVTEREPGTFCFAFDLPSGCYATVVLREFQKAESHTS
ncbi:MAG: tRNA pseudouridine(13) synthase TruD [Planctomycetales bacterium]